MMSINLRVIDPPIFPTKAEPSKRSTLIVAAFMAGLIFVIASIIGREFLDNSLKHPMSRQKKKLEFHL